MVVEFDLEGTMIEVPPATGKVEVKRNDAPDTNITDWVKETLDPGVYVLEGLPKSNSNDSPFDQLCDSRDTRTFVYQRNGEAGAYTLKIGPVGGTADGTVYSESFNAAVEGNTTKGVFNVQVSQNYSGSVFHNSGSGALSSAPLTAGTYPWAITAPSGKTLASGTITVEALNNIGTGGSVPAGVGIESKPADVMDEDGNVDEAATADARLAYYIENIKKLTDGVYVMPAIQDDIKNASSTLPEALDIGDIDADLVRLWKISARGQADTFTLYLYNQNGTLAHDEAVTLTAQSSAALFCLQVTAAQDGTFHNHAGVTTTLNSALAAGTYHWVVRDAEGIIVVQGDVIV